MAQSTQCSHVECGQIYLTTHLLDKLSSLTSIVPILLLETDNCPAFLESVDGRE